VKYGALSLPGGRIRIDWNTMDDKGHRLQLIWREMNGPLIQQPKRRGFGSALIEQNIIRELGGTVVKDFEAAGLICTITVLLERLK
jgi:two-component sensor histidine kinase